MITRSQQRMRLVGLLALAAGGCGADGGETPEQWGTVQARASEPDLACDELPFGGRDFMIDPPNISPQEYRDCSVDDVGYYVSDVYLLDPAYTDPSPVPPAPFIPAKLAVKWADTPLTTALACTRSSLSAYFYWTPDFWNDWTLLEHERAFGRWEAGACVLEVSTPTGTSAGQHFRVAARASRLGVTRKVSIGTYKPVLARP